MQSYSAYYENGRIIPIGNPAIPEGRKLVITVLDESVVLADERRKPKIDDIILASEKSLAKVWLSPAEDKAWADL